MGDVEIRKRKTAYILQLSHVGFDLERDCEVAWLGVPIALLEGELKRFIPLEKFGSKQCQDSRHDWSSLVLCDSAYLEN
jgi:hypothetical protein